MSFLTLPIEVMDGKEQTFEGGKYSCFKDGNAIGAAYGINAPIRAGHAFDNISEFVATLVTSLSVDPNYFPTCLESQSPHLRGQLAGITRAVLTILEYSNPDFISLLKENPNA